VGNSPFLLKEWKLNKIIIVDKNPGYWNADKVKLNGIQFHSIDNKQTEERIIRSGGLHLTNSIPSGKINTYKKEAPQLLKITPDPALCSQSQSEYRVLIFDGYNS